MSAGDAGRHPRGHRRGARPRSREWARCPPAHRQAIFLRAADLMERRRAETIAQLARGNRVRCSFRRRPGDFTVSLLRQSAALPYASIGQMLPSDVPGTSAMAVRRPVGVVGAIAPGTHRSSCPAARSPGPWLSATRSCSNPRGIPGHGRAIWAESLAEAGLPPGVLNVVTHAPGEAGVVGEEMVSNPLVRRINFTGSTATGRRLAESAGRHLKRVVLQLSGHNPLIVLADADIDYAVDAAAYGSSSTRARCACASVGSTSRSPWPRNSPAIRGEGVALPTGDPDDPRPSSDPSSTSGRCH